MTSVQRVAIIGCGFFARNHIEAWRELDGAELVGVCDRDIERAASAGQRTGIPWFDDAQGMINALAPDLVDIVTTAGSHLPLAKLCADFGIAAIIQKPLAFTLSDALAIVDVARTSGTTMMVHENFRFQAPIRKVAELLRSGAIGTPHYCNIGFRCGHDIFVDQPYLKEDDRLVLADIGVHVFDVARFLLGEIEDVSCRVQRVRPGLRGEDMASALVGFASGAMGLVEASWSSFLPDDPFPETLIRLEGDNGSISLDRHYRIVVRSGSTIENLSAEPPVPSWGERPWHVVQDSVRTTCQHWLDSVAQGSPPETSVADNVRTLAAVEASYSSAKQNGAVVRLDTVLSAAARG